MAEMQACRKALSSTLLAMAKENTDLVVVTPDARGSVTIADFAQALPGQFIEAGIAEQDAVGVAAGLALCGKIPFVCAPAPFLSARSYEQIKVDVSYAHTNVKLIGVSGGISYGALGTSHHSTQDIAALRPLPHLQVVLPADGPATAALLGQVAQTTEPVYMRMGRNPVPIIYDGSYPLPELGKANLLAEGNDLTICAAGEMVYYALQAAKNLKEQGISARVLDVHTIKPLDQAALLAAAKETGCLLTVEEHSIFGGLGSAVAEYLAQHCPVPMRLLGLPDEAVIAGDSVQVYQHYQLDAEGIAAAAVVLLTMKR